MLPRSSSTQGTSSNRQCRLRMYGPFHQCTDAYRPSISLLRLGAHNRASGHVRYGTRTSTFSSETAAPKPRRPALAGIAGNQKLSSAARIKPESPSKDYWKSGMLPPTVNQLSRENDVTNAFVLRCIKNDWLLFCLSVCRHFAVCHKMRPYHRDALAAILPKQFKFKNSQSRTIFRG